jgi:hypothetical protein
MAGYIQRRRRWWKLVKELDPEIRLSDNLLGELLLDHANLSATERLMVLTSTRNMYGFSILAVALVQQHPLIHARAARPQGDAKGSGWPHRKGYGRGRGAFKPSGYFAEGDKKRRILPATGIPATARKNGGLTSLDLLGRKLFRRRTGTRPGMATTPGKMVVI